MKTGFYAGTFDPFTIGHLHVVKCASKIFDKVIIGIGNNDNKIRKYETETMKHTIIKTLKQENINNVEVIDYNGLTALVAQKLNATFLIRGIRNGTDYEMEENLAQINEEISKIYKQYIVVQEGMGLLVQAW